MNFKYIVYYWDESEVTTGKETYIYDLCISKAKPSIEWASNKMISHLNVVESLHFDYQINI